MFHLNQDLVPYACAADLICYQRLISTLLEYPEVPVQIHVSGTLTHMLLWTESPTIELIRKGVDSGLFELMVSTYSQNIIAATKDPMLNEHQYKLHRDLMKKTFGAEPGIFWNAERVWTDGVAGMIAGWGHYAVPVESHILIGSGLDSLDRSTWAYETSNGPLKIIHDDAEMRSAVNEVFNTGNLEYLERHLVNLHSINLGRDFLVAYYEDAEAAGLWQYEGGAAHPDSTMKNVKKLLAFLRDTDWIQPTTPGRFFGHVTPKPFPGNIKDGEAKWMITFAENLGYANWFEYIGKNEIKKRLLAVFDGLIGDFHETADLIDGLPEGHPAHALFEHALLYYAAYSYELGASWIWSGNDAGFHRAVDARFALFAAKASLNTENYLIEKDINRDGINEIAWRNGDNLLILSRTEGRILQWYDLSTGSVLLDNGLAYFYAEDFQPGNKRLGLKRGGEGVYVWLNENPLVPEVLAMEYLLRSTGPDLMDTAGNFPVFEKAILSDDAINWEGNLNGLDVEARLQMDETLFFTWTFSNKMDVVYRDAITLKKTFAIDPGTLLDFGPNGLMLTGNGWQNVGTGAGVFRIPDEAFILQKTEKVFFGMMEQYSTTLNLGPGEDAVLTFELGKSSH